MRSRLAVPILVATSAIATFLDDAPSHAGPPWPSEYHGVFEVLITDGHGIGEHGHATETIFRLRDNRGQSRVIRGLERLGLDELPRPGTAVMLNASEQAGVLMALGGPSGGPAPTSTQSSFPPPLIGQRTVLVAVLAFGDTPNSATVASQTAVWLGPATDAVADIMAESSYSNLTISGTVRGTFTLGATMGATCNYSTWATTADTMLRQAGVEPNNYQHVAYILPQTAPCGWSGLAELGGRRMWGIHPDAGVMAHELGHNLGFAHATGAIDTWYEYGDQTSFMGRASAMVLDAAHRYQAGWLAPGAVGLLEASGTYELASLDLPFSGVQQALIMPHATVANRLWFFSAHTPVGRAARTLWTEDRRGPSVHSLSPAFGEFSRIWGTADRIGDTIDIPSEGLRVVHRYVSDARVWVDFQKSCARFELTSANTLYRADTQASRFTFRVKNVSCPDGTALSFDPGTQAPGWTAVASRTTFSLAAGSETSITVDVRPSGVTLQPWETRSDLKATARLTTGEPGVSFGLDYTATYYVLPPGAPYRVAFYGQTSSSKSIEWYYPSSIALVARYEVWRSASGGSFQQIATVTQGTLDARGTYVDNHGNQPYSPLYTIIAIDTNGLRSTRSLMVGTLPAGSAPVTTDDSATTAVGSWVEVRALDNDTDADGHALVLASVAGVPFGTMPENGYSRVRYLAKTTSVWIKGMSAGSTALPYEAYDQMGRKTAGTINVTITSAPSVTKPGIAHDAATIGAGETAVVDVLANDPVQTVGLPITLCGGARPAYFGEAWVADGLVHFRGMPGMYGTERVYVDVCNSVGGKSTSYLDVTVLAGSSLPYAVAGPDFTYVDDDGDGFAWVELGGVVNDPDGGAATATWLLNGQLIGTAPFYVGPLPVGSNVLTLTAQDDEMDMASDDVVVTVLANRPPLANAGPDIVTEDDGSGRGDVLLDASASYDRDGPIAATWSWTESGAPKSASGWRTVARLPLGTTTVTLTITDRGGLGATDTVAVTILPGVADSVHIADLDGARANASASKWRATVTVEVRNDLGQLVLGAVVTGAWSRGGSGSCTTGASGRCSLQSAQLARSSVASITFSTTKIQASLLYAAVDNADPDGDSNGTAITVNRP